MEQRNLQNYVNTNNNNKKSHYLWLNRIGACQFLLVACCTVKDKELWLQQTVEVIVVSL